MRCYKCGDTYKEHMGSLKLHSKFIGDYELFNVAYYKCDGCGNLLFPKETIIKIEEKEQECRDFLIKQLPLGEFVFASETAEILNISRQALHKHLRIKRGFIYSVTLCGKKLYHKKSILLFKEKGDGRFSLTGEVPINDLVQKYVTLPPKPKHREPVYVTIAHEPSSFLSYKQSKTKLIQSFN